MDGPDSAQVSLIVLVDIFDSESRRLLSVLVYLRFNECDGASQGIKFNKIHVIPEVESTNKAFLYPIREFH